MDLSEEELEQLTALFNAFGQKTRLTILLGFYHGETAAEIADQLDISRPGLQSHFVKMRDADLIRKTDDGPYALTPVGTYFAELVESRRGTLLDVTEILADAESDAEQDLEDEVNQDLISETEWQRIVEDEKWERAIEQVRETLNTESI
jgi:predicted ArsR family transcriptional regulator